MSAFWIGGAILYAKRKNKMIHELDKNDYEKARPLFKDLDYQLTITAVIEGTSSGRIYVDNKRTPKTAFICSAEGYFLAGDEDNPTFNLALNKLITETIFAGQTVREGEDALVLMCPPGTWESKLDVIFKSRVVPLRNYGLCYAV